MTMSPAETAEPIEMPFGCGLMWVQENVLGGVQTPTGRGNFEGHDIGIFPHTIGHNSEWLRCWDFPACC